MIKNGIDIWKELEDCRKLKSPSPKDLTKTVKLSFQEYLPVKETMKILFDCIECHELYIEICERLGINVEDYNDN